MRSFIPLLALAIAASAHYHDESTVTVDVTATVFSCSSGVTSCPGSPTPKPESVVSPTVSTIDLTVTDTTSICPKSSTVVVPPSPVYNSTISIPVPPPATTVSTPVVDTSVPVVTGTTRYTVIPITTCIPTTLYSTVPVIVSSTPVVTSGVASGSGIVVPQPSSSPIIPIGSAGTLSGSLTAVGALVVAAFFF